MTSIHPDLDELADAGEGLLSERRREEIERHLAGCAECRARAADLAAVSAVLAGDATPMPAGVAARLDAAVAAESAARRAHQRPAAAAAAAPPVRETLGPFIAAPRRPPARRGLALAAAAALAATAVGFGGYVLSATAGLNEPPAAAALSGPDALPEQAAAVRNTLDLESHPFSRAWRCARGVVHGGIDGLASTTLDGQPALLVYQQSGTVGTVTVVTGCYSGQPMSAATADLPR